jgi:hypothetical protein
MVSLEYSKGFRAALRYLVVKAGNIQQDKGQNKIAKVLAKNTLAWLKACHDNSDKIAEGGDIEFWINPQGELFTKKDKEK